MQIFSKAKRFSDDAFLLINNDFLLKINLAAVRFVRNTDHIAALSQQLGIFGELMNRGEEHPATVAAF